MGRSYQHRDTETCFSDDSLHWKNTEIFLYQFNLDVKANLLPSGHTMSWADVSAERGATATGLCLLQNLCTMFHYMVATCHGPLVLEIFVCLLEIKKIPAFLYYIIITWVKLDNLMFSAT